MQKTNKCLKEWNSIVEALGQGKQSILIRRYHTTLPGFLLYPTYSYTSSNNYLNNFKDESKEFVKENSLPNKKFGRTVIKYYAKVEFVIEKSSNQISRLDKCYIWDKNHVKNYLKGKKGFVWGLRVYELKNHYLAELNRGIRYANLNEDVKISNITPVIDNNKFSEILKQI